MEKAISFQNRLWLGIALLHLVFVSVGAAGIQLQLPGTAGFVLDRYTRITGSCFGYSFFAPGLSDQLMARFEVVDGQGKILEVPFVSGISNEADIRFTSVIDQFASPLTENAKPQRQLELKRSLSASLARIFFRRYPDAKQVIVHLEEYQYASLPAFNAGERPKMKPVYQAKFSLNPLSRKL